MGCTRRSLHGNRRVATSPQQRLSLRPIPARTREGLHSARLDRVVFADREHGWIFGSRAPDKILAWAPVYFILKYVP